MNIAVKTYQHVIQKPAGIPDMWPAETVNLGTGTTLPDNSGHWQLMTETEFNAYKDFFYPDYLAWKTAFDTPVTLTNIWIGVLKRRQDWGLEVINEFRIYVIGRFYPPSVPSVIYTNIEYFEHLKDVGDKLKDGLLVEAKDAFQSQALLPLIIDQWYDSSQTITVRQYFSARILEGM